MVRLRHNPTLGKSLGHDSGEACEAETDPIATQTADPVRASAEAEPTACCCDGTLAGTRRWVDEVLEGFELPGPRQG